MEPTRLLQPPLDALDTRPRLARPLHTMHLRKKGGHALATHHSRTSVNRVDNAIHSGTHGARGVEARVCKVRTDTPIAVCASTRRVGVSVAKDLKPFRGIAKRAWERGIDTSHLALRRRLRKGAVARCVDGFHNTLPTGRSRRCRDELKHTLYAP